MTKTNNSLTQLENKNVVVDTSSLLVDGPALLKKLQKCTVVVPSIVVYELEGIRRRSGLLGSIARQWLRFFEELRIEHGTIVSNGVELPYNSLTIRIQPNDSSQRYLPQHLQDGSADSTILAVAKNLLIKGEKVALLSNDVPMRLHATLDLEMEAFDAGFFEAKEVTPFTGREKVVLTEEEYAHSPLVTNSDNSFIWSLTAPEIENSIVEVYVDGAREPKVKTLLKSQGKMLEIPKRFKVSGNISPQSLEQKVALYYLLKNSMDLPIVSLGGSAGTGKTLLTLASAVSEVNDGNYQKILVLRSLHEMGKGQEMGFLPGTVDEKMAPWAGAINDALEVVNAKNFDADKSLEVSPITYLRGRSLHNTFIILEEAQNFSRSEILNVISRVGVNSKFVMTFDSAQVDNPFLSSGVRSEIWPLIDRLKSEDFAHITLTKTERSKTAELASKILSE